MNKVFRIIWSSAQQCFIVASEFAKGVKKSSTQGVSQVQPLSLYCKLSPLAFAVIWSVSGQSFAANSDAIVAGNSTVVIDNPNIDTTGGSVYASSVSAGGDLTINNGSLVTHGDYAHAAMADGGVFNLDGSYLESHGAWSYGAYAKNGGTLNISNSKIVTYYSKGYGLYALGGAINADKTDITTTRDGANAATAGSSGTLTITNGNITSAGNGLMAHTQGTLTADNMAINLSKSTYSGVYALSSGASLKLSNSNILLNNSGQFGATADGGAVELDTVSIQGNNSTGLNIINGGNITGKNVTVNITDTNPTNNDGIHFSGNTNAVNTLTLDKSNITMLGDNVFGLSSQGGINTANLSNTTLSSEKGTAINAENTSSLIVNADNSTLSGATLLQSGFSAKGGINDNIQLNATNQSILQGAINIDPTQTTASSVTLDNKSVWSGTSSGLQSLSLNNGSEWHVTGDSNLDGLTIKDSMLSFNHGGDDYKLLTIKGNYAATNATLMMSGVLGGDSSETDKLHITGDTSGDTSVIVNNIGGTGAPTINGLQMIQVDGASDGEFTQQGRIVAGAYDYQLVRGQGDNNKNWVLMSNAKLIDPPVLPPVKPPVEPPVDPVTPPVDPVTPPVDPVTPPVDPVTPPVDPVTPPVEPVTMVVRPEAGSYASNMAASNTLFSSSLEQRAQQTKYIDPITGEKKTTSLWMINSGGHNRSSDGSGQLKTQSNRYVLQLGGDVLQWSSNDENRFHLGVMGGYANQHSYTHSNLTGYSSKADIDGYSAGLYATWFQNEASKTGAYVDSWARYNWFNNSVSSDAIGNQSYHSKGITASIEGGYTWQVSQLSERSALFIQPKAQITWMNVKADDFKEENGTQVTGEGSGNVQSRLGVRAYIKGHSKQDDGKERSFEPYVEANWVHNTENFGSTLNDVTINQRGAENLAEVKIGVDAKVNQRLSLWSNIGQQVGTESYSDTSANIGVKVNF